MPPVELISRGIDRYQTVEYGIRAMIYYENMMKQDAYPAWEFSEGLPYRVPTDWAFKG